jgi:hypothetical protein
MSRWLLLALCAAACGDDLHRAVPDAGPPDAPAGPDAPACAGGEENCDGACLDVSNNEQNCGECGNACHGGEVCKSSSCSCPTGVIPGVVFPTGFEQFFGAGGFTLALAPTLSLGGINGLVFGFDTSLPLDTDIDLSTVPLGSTPFVGSAVGLDIQNMSLDTSYVATAGTIRFTTLCDTEIEGTLTNATFNGVGGDLLGGEIPGIDPEGCVIQVNSLAFHLMTKACAKP